MPYTARDGGRQTDGLGARLYRWATYRAPVDSQGRYTSDRNPSAADFLNTVVAIADFVTLGVFKGRERPLAESEAPIVTEQQEPEDTYSDEWREYAVQYGKKGTYVVQHGKKRRGWVRLFGFVTMVGSVFAALAFWRVRGPPDDDRPDDDR